MPRRGRTSATRRGLLIDQAVDIGPESIPVDRGRALEDSDRGVRRDELTLSQRDQFAHWDSVAGDDERLATIERAHDLAAFVA